MIHAITGRLGGGKTLSMVIAMSKFLSVGGHVVTNITLNIDNIAQFYKLPKYYIKAHYHHIDASHSDPNKWVHGDNRGKGSRRVMAVIDEAAEYFSSMDSKSDLKDWMSWLRYSDKQGVDVFFIVQDLSFLQRYGRLLVNRVDYCVDLAKFKFPVIHCQPFWWLKKYIRIATYDAITEQCINVSMFRKNPIYFGFYDTADLVGLNYFGDSSNAYDTQIQLAPRHYSFYIKPYLIFPFILIILNLFVYALIA